MQPSGILETAKATNPVKDLQRYGQSIWLDYIRRNLLTSGELKKLIDEDGLRGMTSNPAIFEKAIVGSTDYTDLLQSLAQKHDLDAKARYEVLAIRDIQDAADFLRPVYDATRRRDGYVSLEVSPYLARDTNGTLDEARRLWKAVARENVMIKVPGTAEGIPAFQQLIGEGININVTLLFAQEVYEKVAEAYIAGLEQLSATGGDVSKMASVASFFISRIDTLVDSKVNEKLKAKPVDVGRYDLVLHPSHLWLTIHESIGHPTELDRAMGYEANYAGTSFVSPPEKMLGKLKYGPEFMNVQGDRSQEGGLSTIGYDDEGVKPEDFLIIKNGIFNDYQTTREQANWLKWWYDSQNRPTQSHGCSFGDSWSSIQFQRMPNVSLLPGDKEQSYEDLIAATDRGIAIVGDGSFSIDQQRYNAQFGGQTFHEIKGGKIVGMLKDVAYQIRTPDFWNSMDMIGGKKSYEMGGSFFDGKGQPPQINSVSHGSPPARFRNINVINTGRKS